MRRFLAKLDILGLALLLGSVAAYSIKEVWNKYLTIACAVGGALLVVGVAAKYREILESLRRRSTLFSVNSLASVVLVVGILGLVNFIGYRHQKRFDLTQAKTYTLSDQTIKVLNSLNQPVHVKAFFPGGDYRPLKDLLVEYKSRSRHLDFEFIDPDKQPQVAKSYGVRVYGTFRNPFTGMTTEYGTLVLERGDRKEKIEKQDEEVREEDLTNALIKLMKSETKTIYFLAGHGEKSPEKSEQDGLSRAKQALERERYEVKTLNLVQQEKVPDDCAVLVIAGPTAEPFSDEIRKINDYLNRGGSVLVMVDPPPAPGLKDFLQGWGIEVGDNLVLDVSGVGRLFGAGPEIPLVTDYSSHKITERFNLMTFYPLARSVAPASKTPEGVHVEKLLETNPNSWGETELQARSFKFDEGKDLKGPVPIGVVATKELNKGEEKADGSQERGRKARLVVFGDSDFASDAYFRLQGNGNLLINALNWLAQDESFIAIRPKNPKDRRLVLSESQRKRLQYISIVLIPLACLITGVTVWVKRRR